jgi:uncharacterized protein (TIGR03084 family)
MLRAPTWPCLMPRENATMSAASAAGLSQALDFRAECDELYAVLVAAPAAAWRMPTQFKGWTFDDILGHLNFSDYAAAVAARSREEVHALFHDVHAARAAGISFADYTRRWLQGCAGPDLLARWREQYGQLAATFEKFAPEQRLAWAGPDMSARSFMSARQMETWAHGQAVYDTLGLERVEHDRLRNIAVMGVNTFGWSFKVHQREVPAEQPCVRLTSPSGATWEWNEAKASSRIEGSAVDFCRVVTQTRNVRDTALIVIGDSAVQWMEIAQCFAGPPEQPPVPGTRGPSTQFA